MNHIKYRTKRTLRNIARNKEIINTERRYKESLKIFSAQERKANIKMAVVIHLYYVESWPLFKQKLNKLSQVSDYGIFITMPKKNSAFKEVILGDFPGAVILEAPNMGRDVLPFIMVAKKLSAMGYEYVLKIHSKKSTHRTDGDVWLNEMIANLIPEQKSILQKIIATLDKKNTAIVGPKGQYVSLLVNFEANGTHMTYIMSRLFSKKLAYEYLQLRRSDFGFFAGTMFWARLDAIENVLNKGFSSRYFESESGQIDATFAHALERIFCLVPEIEHKNIYASSSTNVEKIDYNGGYIPDWSNVYVGPRKK